MTRWLRHGPLHQGIPPEVVQPWPQTQHGQAGRPWLTLVAGACAAMVAMSSCSGSPRSASPAPTQSPNPELAVFTLPGAGAPRAAFDWNGARATLTPLPAGYVAAQSQDGRDIVIDDGIYSLDSGQHVGSWPKGSAVFASAGADTCGVRDDQPGGVNVPNATEYLWVNARKVRAVGANGRFGAPTILACSTTEGFAVLGGGENWAITPASVYRLRDGKVLWQFKGNGQLTVSADGRIMAVVQNASIQIVSLPGGRRIGSVAMDATPIGFSGDGSRLAVTVPSQPRFQSYVVEWRTGVTIWSHIDGVAVVRSQPAGPGMILMTPHISSGPHEFWLLPRSGAPIRLAA